MEIPTEVKELVLPHCPVSNKKSFISEASGVEWDDANRAKNPNIMRHFVFQCDDCPYWHLTPISPELAAAPAPPKASAPAPKGRPTGKKNVDPQEVYRLHQGGMAIGKIADKLDVSPQTVTYHLKKFESEKETTRPVEQPVTLSQIAQKKLELQKQLEEMERTEKRLLEEKAMRFKPVDPVTVEVFKEGRTIVLTKMEIAKLCNHFGFTHAAIPATTAITKFTPRKNDNASVWDRYPEFATDEEKTLPIFHAASGTRVANGYKSVVSIGTYNRQTFIEVADSQVVKTQFVLDKAQEDYLPYETYVTPGGFRARRYTEDDGEMLAGCWYLHMNHVVPGVPTGAVAVTK